MHKGGPSVSDRARWSFGLRPVGESRPALFGLPGTGRGSNVVPSNMAAAFMEYAQWLLHSSLVQIRQRLTIPRSRSRVAWIVAARVSRVVPLAQMAKELRKTSIPSSEMNWAALGSCPWL